MNMQFKISSSLLVALVFSIFTFSQNNEDVNIISSDVMSVKVVGMHCAGGCAMALQKVLNNTDGVLAANVDFGSSIAMIEYDSSSDQDAIISVIKEMRGGAYEVTLVSDTKVLDKNNSSKLSCSKGKQCCKVNGKLNANCDQKSSGCCSSSKQQCSSKKTNNNQKK